MNVLKYTITKKLLRLPGTYQTNRYKLCIAIGINDRTLKRWMAVLQTDKFSIPSDYLYRIAEFLACKPDDLLSKYEPQHQISQSVPLQQ